MHASRQGTISPGPKTEGVEMGSIAYMAIDAAEGIFRAGRAFFERHTIAAGVVFVGIMTGIIPAIMVNALFMLFGLE